LITKGKENTVFSPFDPNDAAPNNADPNNAPLDPHDDSNYSYDGSACRCWSFHQSDSLHCESKHRPSGKQCGEDPRISEEFHIDEDVLFLGVQMLLRIIYRFPGLEIIR
jgi:hypothetical protein